MGLVVRSVQRERVNQPLGQCPQDLLLHGLRFGSQPGNQVIARLTILCDGKWCEQPNRVALHGLIQRNAVGHAVPFFESGAFRPALRPAQVADRRSEIGSVAKELRIECHIRPRHGEGLVFRQASECVEDERGLLATRVLIQDAERHVMPRVGMDSTGRQFVDREFPREYLDELLKALG